MTFSPIGLTLSLWHLLFGKGTHSTDRHDLTSASFFLCLNFFFVFPELDFSLVNVLKDKQNR
ncbi:MAG: hypothetical protein AAGA60_08660 [Cyanobacteria bacterium P01_E01_bin.42]